MKANASQGTSIEINFGKLLWRAGVRYRKNDKSVFGKPDFVVKGCRLAIFCDGDFWHGRDWAVRKLDHKTNCAFWHAKIERTMLRDKEVTCFLQSQGWKVFRFWETELKRMPDKCLNEILSYMNCKKKSHNLMDRILKGENRNSMHVYGPHSLNPDGSIISPNLQAAVVTHYIHNEGSVFAKPYETCARGLIKDLVEFNKELHNDILKNGTKWESLFPELYSAPFRPDEKPAFSFIDLFAGIGGFRMAMQNLGGKCVFSSEWRS